MALQLQTWPGDGSKPWPLESTRVTIGRSSRCDVQLVDATVSKEHAEILRGPDGWSIRDLGSRNGTRVNGDDARDPTSIRAGDRLEIGHVLLEVRDDRTVPGVRFSDATVMGSSLKLRADQILDRQSRRPTGNSKLVHLLAEAGGLLVKPQPLADTCGELLAFVEKAVPASRYVLLLQDGAGGDPVQIAARTRGGRASQPLALSRSIMRNVMDECESVLTADAAHDPRFQAQHSIVTQAVQSAMAVPLFDNHRVLGVLYVDSQTPSIRFDEEQLELMTLLANMAAVKITNARLLESEQSRARLAQDLATATRIQRGMLPPMPPRLPGWSFDAYLETCFEVGGDLYDFHVTPDGRVMFLLGDVSGKGMGAALLMSTFLASARVLYTGSRDLVELSTRLGNLMFASAEPGRFVTGFLASLDPATGLLRYVNAGHPPACVMRDGELRELEATGVPFGTLPDFPYEEASTVIEPGETFALFSDGLPEAQCGEEFLDNERLYAMLREHGPAPTLEEARSGILERVREFVADTPRTDDITLMLLRRDRGA
jgi:phosphoserine phosphatase RsbU/P